MSTDKRQDWTREDIVRLTTVQMIPGDIGLSDCVMSRDQHAELCRLIDDCFCVYELLDSRDPDKLEAFVRAAEQVEAATLIHGPDALLIPEPLVRSVQAMRKVRRAFLGEGHES